VQLAYGDFNMARRDWAGTCLLLRSVSKKPEVTDAHEAIGQYVEQEAADKFVGLQSHRLFSIPVFSISIAQDDFSVFNLESTVIG